MGLRIRVDLDSLSPVVLPLTYNHLIQSFIYKMFSKVLPEIHKVAPEYGGRKYRPFVFSKLFGQSFNIKRQSISFEPPVFFYFASPDDVLMEVLANELINSESIRLGSNALRFTKISSYRTAVSTGECLVRTLSPVTVHSTLSTPDGKKKTYYYNPREKDFAAQIRSNMVRKLSSLSLVSKMLHGGEFSIEPVRNIKERIVIYKGFVIHAWDGIFKLSGDSAWISCAFDWGLGARNAQGFGMIDQVGR